MTVRFSDQLVPELYQQFWAAWQSGAFSADAAAAAGTYRQRGLAWLRQAGGVRPRRGRADERQRPGSTVVDTQGSGVELLDVGVELRGQHRRTNLPDVRPTLSGDSSAQPVSEAAAQHYVRTRSNRSWTGSMTISGRACPTTADGPVLMRPLSLSTRSPRSVDRHG